MDSLQILRRIANGLAELEQTRRYLDAQADNTGYAGRHAQRVRHGVDGEIWEQAKGLLVFSALPLSGLRDMLGVVACSALLIVSNPISPSFLRGLPLKGTGMLCRDAYRHSTAVPEIFTKMSGLP